MANRRRTAQKKQSAKKTINTIPLYIAIVVLFVAYFIFESTLAIAIVLGAALFFLIIATLVIEISNGFKEEGAAKNITEILIAIIIVVVFWLLLRFFLNTPNPLDVVPSCSMLPALQRGSMILVQGVNQNNINAPIVNVSQAAWSSSFSNVGTESFQCVAYRTFGPTAEISQFIEPGYQIGLLESTPIGSQIVPYSAQDSNLVKYTCGAVSVQLQNGTVVQEASTTAITIGNTTITGDRNNSIVVYQTLSQDEFYRDGDTYIVHRVYAILNVSGTYYTLTKGDNNPGLDIQYMNSPANLSQIGGKVIGSVPYLGYIKLILSNNFVEPTGCNYTTIS